MRRAYLGAMRSAPVSSVASIVALAGALASGCVIGDVDLAGRRCPCVDGWICDEATERCVPADASDGGAVLATDARVPPDAPPPPPTCETIPDAIFCDDFERADLARWMLVEPAIGGGDATTTTAAARVGDRGLLLTTPAGTSVTRLAAAIDTAGIDDLYFHALVRVSGRSAGTLEVFELSAGDEGSIAAQLLPESESYVVRVAAAGSAALTDEGRAGRWSVGTWTCVQGRVVRSEARGRVEIVDPGPLQAILTDVETDWGSPYDVFAVTLAGGSGDVESRIELDDVMWTRRAVPCPQND